MSSSDKHAGGLLPSDCGKYVKILSEPINDLGPAYIVPPLLALFEMFYRELIIFIEWKNMKNCTVPLVDYFLAVAYG